MSFNEHSNSNLGFTTPARRNPAVYASPSIPTASPLNPYPTPPISFGPALRSSVAIPSKYASKADSALDAAKDGLRSKQHPLRKVVIDQAGNMMLLPIPLIDDLLHPAESGADVNTIFKSSNEAKAYPFYPPRHEQFEDDSIPRNETQKRAMVKAMVDALKSTNYAEDNVNMIRPFLKNKYGETRIEIACWKLLDSCISIHTEGSLLGRYDIDAKHSKLYPKFADRFQQVLLALMTQKTICKHVLDPFYLHQFVEDPNASVKRVASNKTLNRRKGEVMAAGKAALNASLPDSSSPVVNVTPKTPTTQSRAATAVSPGSMPTNLDTPETFKRGSSVAFHLGSLADESPCKKARQPKHIRHTDTAVPDFDFEPLATETQQQVDLPVRSLAPSFSHPYQLPGLESSTANDISPDLTALAADHQAIVDEEALKNAIDWEYGQFNVNPPVPHIAGEPPLPPQLALEQTIVPKVIFEDSEEYVVDPIDTDTLDQQFWDELSTQHLDDPNCEINYVFQMNPNFSDTNLDPF